LYLLSENEDELVAFQPLFCLFDPKGIATCNFLLKVCHSLRTLGQFVSQLAVMTHRRAVFVVTEAALETINLSTLRFRVLL